MTRTIDTDNDTRREIAGRHAGSDVWLESLREEAFAHFEAQGLPTLKWEEWRHTNVSAIAETPFERAAEGQTATAGIAPEQLGHFTACPVAATRIVFVNGRYAPELSQVDTLPEGVTVQSISETLRTEPELLENDLGRYIATRTQPFAALNTAHFEDGAFVHIGRWRAVREPIVLLHLSTATGGPTVSHPRHLIVADEGSVASIVEVYAGLGEGEYLTNAVTEISVGEGATLDHVKVQREVPSAYHIAGMAVRQEARSTFSSHSIGLGGGLVRNDIHLRLNGTDADATLNGLSVVDGERHADNHTVIEHAAERCSSRETYHTILSGAARGVFAGRIIVRPGAQQTDARQSSRNLLLSKEALAHAMPQLEIFADDVKCTHGATVGALDDDAVFYLRARGVPEPAARGLLTYAFANEILQSVRVEALRERLQNRLLTGLTGGEGSA